MRFGGDCAEQLARQSQPVVQPISQRLAGVFHASEILNPKIGRRSKAAAQGDGPRIGFIGDRAELANEPSQDAFASGYAFP